MSAFNWIKTLGTCPNCKVAANLIIQIHTASSYDGDELGRFHNETYLVGDKMRWWPFEHSKFRSWTEDAIEDGGSYLECCHAKCDRCKQECYVVLRFRNLVIESIEDIGLMDEWPSRFP